MLTPKQKEICKKYSKRDKYGFVHCNECPLVIDHYWCLCKAHYHYDRHKRAWVEDGK